MHWRPEATAGVVTLQRDVSKRRHLGGTELEEVDLTGEWTLKRGERRASERELQPVSTPEREINSDNQDGSLSFEAPVDSCQIEQTPGFGSRVEPNERAPVDSVKDAWSPLRSLHRVMAIWSPAQESCLLPSIALSHVRC